MAAGRMPSGRTTRRLLITRSPAMEKFAQQVLRYAPPIRGDGTDVVDGADLGGESCQWIAASGYRGFGAQAAQWNRRHTAQCDPRLARRPIQQTRKTYLRD